MSEIVNNITCHKNVCSEVVAKNLCIGCGICAGICPRENLKIEFNKFGEYNAIESGDNCDEKCNLCLKVCPFYDNKDNEDTLGRMLFAGTPGIKHKPETGYYIDSFVGYSIIKGHRENGASGGLATWTLEQLLTDNLVDHVACVSPNNDPEKLFKFKICNTPEEVRECSRSCYYPVETSEVIKHILSHKGRYAIIALPCMCKSIRLAMQQIPRLKRRIRFVLGLVCSQTKSKFFAEYICGLGGGNPFCLDKVIFRIKIDEKRPLSDHAIKLVSRNENHERNENIVYYSQGLYRIWGDRYFTPNACNFCNDVFAELADVTFMGAWLPDYKDDSKGHSLCLFRNNLLGNLVKSLMLKNEGELKPVSINDTIYSERGGVFDNKVLISTRIAIANKLGLAKRATRSFQCLKSRYDQRLEAGIQFRISRESPSQWISSGKDIERFKKRMKWLTVRLGVILKTRKFLKKLLGR
jgi:coenzyme F420 hydrogenase subunit beta